MRVFKRILKYILIILLLIAVIDASLIIGFAKLQPQIPKSDAAIVLGAAIGSPAAYNRALRAAVLVEAGKTDTVVVSGGKISDSDQSEAQYMAKVITSKTSEQKPVIILEPDSHSTYENIKNARAKIPEAKSVVIVSDEFHLARGFLLAKRAGFQDVFWTSPEPDYYKRGELLWYYLREFAAMINYIPHFIRG